ncbi:MAG: hypothetical protein LM577_03975 [Thermoproteaceae archaeon]|nr:hypothetical protein [Thermoproteaceae archaeon]
MSYLVRRAGEAGLGRELKKKEKPLIRRASPVQLRADLAAVQVAKGVMTVGIS